MGREKQKSKSISNTVNPKWREAFDFYWYEEMDSFMEMTIWDKDVGSKDDFMGRLEIVFSLSFIGELTAVSIVNFHLWDC